jgi:hypothetical protein
MYQMPQIQQCENQQPNKKGEKYLNIFISREDKYMVSKHMKGA